MKLTKKLLSYIHRVFDKDHKQFVALRVGCDGSALLWSVQDAVLTMTPTGGTAAPLTVDLTAYTVAQLAAYIASQTGYTVSYVDGSDRAQLGSRVLLDGSGTAPELYGYTSLLWAYTEANAQELKTAADQIDQLTLQMSTKTASDLWLDELGSYYAVPRNQGELDPQYSARIIATVIRPLANNVAIQELLKGIGGSQLPVVKDYDVLVNNSYGLFDIDFYVSLDVLAVLGFLGVIGAVTSVVDNTRDAGTFLRRLAVIVQTQTAIASAGCMIISGETVTVVPA